MADDATWTVWKASKRDRDRFTCSFCGRPIDKAVVMVQEEFRFRACFSCLDQMYNAAAEENNEETKRAGRNT